jgi:hypothetical protein
VPTEHELGGYPDYDTVVDSLYNDLTAAGLDFDEFMRPLQRGVLDPVFVIDWVGQIQDDVIEARSAPWPACPGHPHPMELDLSEEWLVWRCPETKQQVAEFGGLSHSS